MKLLRFEDSMKKRKPSARGSRIPDDFTLTDGHLAFAAKKGLNREQAEEIFEEFTDYWRSISGQKAVKVDWEATLRNWIRNSAPGGRFERFKKTRVEPPPRYSRAFEEFWANYPRPEGKVDSWAAWQRQASILEGGEAELLDLVKDALPDQAERWVQKDGNFSPLPEKYLNQRRWED